MIFSRLKSKSDPKIGRFLAAFFIFVCLASFGQSALAAGRVSALITDTLDSKKEFFVDKGFDAKGRSKADFILKKVSDKAYFYVDAGYWDSISAERKDQFMASIGVVSAEFDQKIYPVLTSFWGDVQNPGVDNDPKISIMFGDLITNAAGYFNSGDEFTTAQNAESNQREMIYINSSFFDNPKLKIFIAHEFQHLITYNQKDLKHDVEDDVWTNEMRSEMTATILGYNDVFSGSNLEKRAQEFMQYQSEPVLEWANKYADYASITMFSEYLRQRFGLDLFKELMKSPHAGIESMNDALAASGYPKKFEDVFSDWVLASYFNDQMMGSEYYYSNPGLRNLALSATLKIYLRGTNEVTISDSSKDWTPVYYYFDGQSAGNFRASFSMGDGSRLRVLYVAEDSAGKKKVYFVDMPQGGGMIIVPDFGTNIKSVVVAPIFISKTDKFTENDPTHSLNINVSVSQSAIVPVIDSLDKEGLSFYGGEKISVKGEGFLSGIKALVGSKEAKVSFVDERNIVIEAPPAERSGYAPLQVINPDGGSFTKNSAFLYYPDIKEGSLIRAVGDYKVYIINAQGFKRHILNPQVFGFYSHFRWEDIMEVEPQIPGYYKDSFLFRQDGQEKVYEINADLTKHWLDMTAEAFVLSGRSWGAIFTINSQEMAIYKEGAKIIR
jgi:Zn-dependent peptidase ImmA (M78 family)